MELTVYNISGEDTGRKVKLNNDIFEVEPNDHTIYLDVKQYLANQRQGTHKAKERGEIKGSTRKIKKQKGTGTARVGSIKSPILRGGGRIFGPRPRDYHFKLNKKVKRLARKSVLSYKAKENKIIILEDFSFDKPKTKDFLAIKNNLKIKDKKITFILAESDKNLYLSSRNVKHSNIVLVSELSSYELMNSSSILFLESSLAKLDEIFNK
ncbi:MAG: 50S ribosomal protein L4 [Bacteroidetes bacterium 4572_128]|nr:MAG: 50S ribosomal protein L4 [Bacteroidetes bacterium 4572_128]